MGASGVDKRELADEEECRRELWCWRYEERIGGKIMRKVITEFIIRRVVSVHLPPSPPSQMRCSPAGTTPSCSSRNSPSPLPASLTSSPSLLTRKLAEWYVPPFLLPSLCVSISPLLSIISIFLFSLYFFLRVLSRTFSLYFLLFSLIPSFTSFFNILISFSFHRCFISSF